MRTEFIFQVAIFNCGIGSAGSRKQEAGQEEIVETVRKTILRLVSCLLCVLVSEQIEAHPHHADRPAAALEEAKFEGEGMVLFCLVGGDKERGVVAGLKGGT